MSILALLVSATLVASPQSAKAPLKQSDFIPAPDTLGKERQEFYQAISSQLNVSWGIKARANLQAMDAFGTAFRGNNDGGVGATYIFPAGHSDRLYVTGINPGWNAEQDMTYNSVTCFSRINGQYATVWTIDWRDKQASYPPKNGMGLAKLIALDPQRVDHKFISPEITRLRPYAVYKRGDENNPWRSEFYDEQCNRIGFRASDASSTLVFNTLVEENEYLTKNP
jgi:hypothetical protein